MPRSRASWGRKGKYNNTRTCVDGLWFDSKLEAARWQELLLLQKAGEIIDLRRQVPYRLDVNGMLICRIVPDFQYVDKRTGTQVVEDTKGIVTADCAIKLKLLKAIHGIDVQLVRKK
ncbi:DUF1064 domain-containing protein [Limnoglobus roseus]|uniref:DUF1064 domain-containing protein n=1 Tax=Limnoglobus roseus TaxID=2598579 RepID=A0A5C1AJE8_9BACT|nr:DUF1064 domain-containing protein [Limnoglobus roseus]QEL19321.1 hypothetical protein PX52LOC_06389 [Limnoglobus roseus]